MWNLHFINWYEVFNRRCQYLQSGILLIQWDEYNISSACVWGSINTFRQIVQLWCRLYLLCLVLSYFCPITHFEQSASDLMNTIYKNNSYTYSIFNTIQFYVYQILKIFCPPPSFFCYFCSTNMPLIDLKWQ